MDWFEEKLDEIDTAIFTGDALEYGRNPEILKEYVERWLRELSVIEGIKEVEE